MPCCAGGVAAGKLVVLLFAATPAGLLGPGAPVPTLERGDCEAAEAEVFVRVSWGGCGEVACEEACEGGWLDDLRFEPPRKDRRDMLIPNGAGAQVVETCDMGRKGGKCGVGEVRFS